MATMKTPAKAILSVAASIERLLLTGLKTRESAHATTMSRGITRYRLAMPSRNRPLDSVMSLAVFAGSPGVTSPFTMTMKPKMDSTDRSSRAIPAVRLAVRIDRFGSVPAVMSRAVFGVIVSPLGSRLSGGPRHRNRDSGGLRLGRAAVERRSGPGLAPAVGRRDARIARHLVGRLRLAPAGPHRLVDAVSHETETCLWEAA